MQPLENDEDPLGISRLDAYPVVGDIEQPLGVLLPAPDLDGWTDIRSKLDGVGDQILEDRAQKGPITGDRRQRVGFDESPVLGDGGLEMGNRGGKRSPRDRPARTISSCARPERTPAGR